MASADDPCVFAAVVSAFSINVSSVTSAAIVAMRATTRSLGGFSGAASVGVGAVVLASGALALAQRASTSVGASN